MPPCQTASKSLNRHGAIAEAGIGDIHAAIAVQAAHHDEMRIAVLQDGDNGTLKGQELLEIHSPIAGAFEAARLDKVLHIEQREAAPMLDLDRLRHAQHAAGDFALRNRILQGIGEDGGERRSTAARIPFLDDNALLANFLKRADRAAKGEVWSEGREKGEEANGGAEAGPLMPRTLNMSGS